MMIPLWLVYGLIVMLGFAGVITAIQSAALKADRRLIDAVREDRDYWKGCAEIFVHALDDKPDFVAMRRRWEALKVKHGFASAVARETGE